MIFYIGYAIYFFLSRIEKILIKKIIKWKGIETNAKCMLIGEISFREEKQIKKSASLNQLVINMWIVSHKVK